MNGLFWLVRGDGHGFGFGFGFGDGDGGIGYGDGYGHGDGYGIGAESDIHTPRILAVPRTLGAHAAAAQTGVLSFIKE